MRWKLLVIASLLAALVGACVFFVALPSLTSVPMRETLLDILTSPLSPLLYAAPPAAAAAVFVYRHTPRRRKLQAAVTVLLSLCLAFALVQVVGYFITRV
ncbi:MAG TPA: hypothetical protein VIP46_19910 [Pyrinomonadaceae bacterium]